MSRIVPLSGAEASRATKAAEISENELHTTSDQQRLFLENGIVAPVWHGAVADATAMVRLANRHNAATVSAAAGDNSFNDSGPGFPGNWTAGDILTVDGFTDPANNGALFEIVSATSAKIVVTGATVLVTEAAGAPITMTKNGTRGCWPGDKCKRSDIGTIWECITNNGKTVGDWIEITSDRIGTVKMWSGTAANIPTGYGLCDGGGGRPNLVDRFVLGTATDGEVGNTGGTAAHKHDIGTIAATAASAGTPTGNADSGGGHTHGFTQSANALTPDLLMLDLVTGVAAQGTTDSGGAHTHTLTMNALGTHTHTMSGKTANPENGAGSTATNDVLPPWYKLAFIIRVS